MPPGIPPTLREIRFDGRRAMSVLDAAYRLDTPEDAWLASLTEAVAPALDHGAGVHSFAVDLGAGRLGSPRLHGGDAEWTARWREVWWNPLMASMDLATMRGLANFGPLSYTHDLWAATVNAVPTFELLLERVGAWRDDQAQPESVGRYPDSLNLVAMDVSGAGVGFCANRAARSLAPPSTEAVELAGLVAAHVAAALRLRAAKRADRPFVDSSDVLFTDRGDVVNVREGVALDETLDELRHAARTVVRTKDEATDDSDGRASLVLWQVLFAKSFSVVDVFDRDGRRYLVANRNRPTPDASLASRLSPRECEVVSLLARGHSNKLIGYELDMSASTVANHVASATRKLGARGTSELIAFANAAHAGDASPPRTEPG